MLSWQPAVCPRCTFQRRLWSPHDVTFSAGDVPQGSTSAGVASWQRPSRRVGEVRDQGTTRVRVDLLSRVKFGCFHETRLPRGSFAQDTVQLIRFVELCCVEARPVRFLEVTSSVR